MGSKTGQPRQDREATAALQLPTRVTLLNHTGTSRIDKPQAAAMLDQS